MFVAVYQRSLKLLYVDALLKRVKAEFTAQYSPKRFDYATFDETFRSALREAEAQADAAKRPGAIQAGLQGQVRGFLRFFTMCSICLLLWVAVGQNEGQR